MIGLNCDWTPRVKRLAFLIIVTTVGTAIVHAQPPGQESTTPEQPPHRLKLSPGEIPTPIAPAPDPDAAQKIEQMLRGDDVPAAPGVLGDVLEMLRRQGSVLDGSALDPRSARSELLPSEQVAGSPPGSNSSQATQNRRQNVEVAEALLRTARMLESLPRDTVQRPAANNQLLPIDQLVKQMRMQATGLLVTEFPDAVRLRSANP